MPFEGYLKSSEAEGGVAARVETDVHQLVIQQRDQGIGAYLAGLLGVARLAGVALPGGVNLDGCPVYRIEAKRALVIAGGLHLDGAEAADQGVLDHLFEQGAKTVRGVRFFQRAAQGVETAVGIGDFGCVVAAADADLPVHAGDLVLDEVDGAARDRGLGEAAEVGGGGLDEGRLPVGAGAERAEDRGEKGGLAGTFGGCCDTDAGDAVKGVAKCGLEIHGTPFRLQKEKGTAWWLCLVYG